MVFNSKDESKCSKINQDGIDYCCTSQASHDFLEIGPLYELCRCSEYYGIIDVGKKEHISMENSKIFETLEKIKCDEQTILGMLLMQ